MYYLQSFPRNAVEPSPGCAHEDGGRGRGAARGAWRGACPAGSIPSSREFCQVPPLTCTRRNPPTSLGVQVLSAPTEAAPARAVPASRATQIRVFPALLQVGHPSACLARMRIQHQLLPEGCSGHRKYQSLLTAQRVQPSLLRAGIIWRLLRNEGMMNVSISRTRKAMGISGR